MTRPSPRFGALVLAAAVAATALTPRPAVASKADAFEGKIQPVSGKLYRKEGRLELTLGGDLSLNDAFFQKRLADVKLAYHFTDAWSLALHGAFGTSVATSSASVCPANQGCRAASDADLYQVPGRIHSIVGAEVAWAPIYGKLNVFAEKVAHIDLSLLGGADYLIHDVVLSSQAAAAGQTPGQEGSVGLHVGLGVRLYLNETFAVRFDVKDYVYGVKVPNVAEKVNPDIQNQIMAELGVSVFFPFSNRRQP